MGNELFFEEGVQRYEIGEKKRHLSMVNIF
jgi:hypothetical protein